MKFAMLAIFFCFKGIRSKYSYHNSIPMLIAVLYQVHDDIPGSIFQNLHQKFVSETYSLYF